MPKRKYIVQLNDSSEVEHEDADIASARAWARETHKVRNPKQVRRKVIYRLCEVCDSRPCCCG